MAEDKRGLIERLLVERISLQGICRAVGVTLKWLLGFLVQCFEALPDHLHVQPVSCTRDVLIQRLEVEAAALASFVQKKANKQWVWIAMDAKTRQIIAFHVGDRSHTSAEHLWAKIPHAYRQHATFYTDHYVSPFAISFRSYVNFQPIEYTLVMLIDISCGCSECFVQNMPIFIVFINLVYLDPNL